MTEGRLDVGGYEKSAGRHEGGELTERIEEISLVCITSRAEIRQVLAESGFAVKNEWRDYDFAPYQEGDSLLVVEAMKRD